MLRWIDNFEGYVVPNSWVASSDMAKNYALFGTGIASSQALNYVTLTSQPENRNCLVGYNYGQTPTTTYALTKPLSDSWAVGQTTFIGFRVVNATNFSGASTSAGQFGLANVSGGAYAGTLIKIGVTNASTITIAYMASGVVNLQTVNLVQPLSGTSDYFEVSMTPQSSALGTFSLWVNNRIAYTGSITPFAYTASQLSWVIYGSLCNNTPGTSGTYVYGSGLVLPTSIAGSFGITDFYVSDDTAGLNTGRLGRIRVTSRAPAGDATPNQWTPYTGSTEPTHAAIVANVPADAGKYVATTSAAQTELYSGLAFPAMGSEQVVGMLVRVMASKDDPQGPDIAPLVKSGATLTSITPTLLSSTIGYVNAVLEKNPATNAAWLASEANNSNFGFVSGSAP